MGEFILEIINAYGYAGIFLVAFLASTILPGSSEAALAAGLLSGLDAWTLVSWASAGNCLACLLNYGLGYFLADRTRSRIEASSGGRRALAWATRYGPWSLIASWLPIIGDPLTIVAGYLRFSLGLFVPLVFGLRIGRYIVLLGLFGS